jgi:bifunctional non-homologous end joining protein LigD
MKAKSAGNVAAAVAGRPSVMEPKMDGHRAMLYVDRSKTRLFAAAGREKTGKLPRVEEMARAFPPGTWLDGEVVSGEGKTAGWGSVQSVMGSGGLHPAHESLRCVLFDVVAVAGRDVCDHKLEERRAFLEAVFDELGNDGHLRLIDRLPADQRAYDRLVKKGFEGTIVKHLGSRYVPGTRSSSWLKVKFAVTDEAVVMGYKAGEAGFSGFIGSIIFGQYVDGKLVERGKCSGMDWAIRSEITAHKKEFLGRVFEFSHNGLMPSGGYRHPQFKRWRDDKPAEECLG